MATNLDVGKYKNILEGTCVASPPSRYRRAIFEFYVCSQ